MWRNNKRIFYMLITPEHHELQQKYQALVLDGMVHKQQLQQKEEEKQNLISQITPLKNVVEQLSEKVDQLLQHSQKQEKIIEEKDKKIDELSMIQIPVRSTCQVAA